MEQESVKPTMKSYLALSFALTIPLAWIFWIPMILINRGIWTPPVPVPTLVWSTLGAISPLLALGIIERVSRKQIKLEAIFKNLRLKEFRSLWTLASPFFQRSLLDYSSGKRFGETWQSYACRTGSLLPRFGRI